jgi:NAD+ kinase
MNDIPIAEARGPVRRVLLLSHKAPEVTESALPGVLSILEASGIELLVPEREVRKHPILDGCTRASGIDLRPGGEDLILVLGGDGSILRALAREAGTGAPVIGINYGRVGFLASIERRDLESGLRRALAGEYVTLELPSLRASWAEGEANAVNDLALLRGGEARLADLSYAVNGEPVANVRCDGMVCSTPVGSTAYNLAVGGPTVSWGVRCYVVSFLAAHHLDARPLVLARDEQFTVTNAAVVGDCDIYGDGQRIGSLGPGRAISMDLMGAPVHLGSFPESSFFRRYREKFGRP